MRPCSICRYKYPKNYVHLKIHFKEGTYGTSAIYKNMKTFKTYLPTNQNESNLPIGTGAASLHV